MMNRVVLLVSMMLCLCWPRMASAQSASQQMLTPWAERLDVSKAWNEYPRPLLVREKWKNLNGRWQYAVTPKDASRPSRWDGHIQVPYCLESALSGVKGSLTADQALWYRTTLDVPKNWTKDGRQVMLNFGAVDWEATVWVNGTQVGHHTGGYTAFSCDVTKAVKAGKDNELVLKVLDGTDTGYQPCGKQRTNARGIWYTPVSGIWQTVWMETVPEQHIKSLWTQSDITKRTLTIHVDATGGKQIEAKVKARGKVVAKSATAVNRGALTDVVVTIPEAQLTLWNTENPFLYDVELTLTDDNGKSCDKVGSYAAMREFGSKRDSDGHWRFTLNGKTIFQFGLLDQGWWPDGLYTAPSTEALYYDIDQTKLWGYNLIRKHVKVEPALWYAHCDRAGIIVWQDMPSGDLGTSPDWQRESYFRGPSCNRSQASVDNYYREWEEIIDQFRGYPCIASWIPFNERWGQFNTWSVTKWTKAKDPTRLVNPASGGNFFCTGDVLDMHNYPEPKMPLNDPDRVNVVGEYGGIGFPVKGHTWVESDKNWGYVKFTSAEEVTDTYIEYANLLLQLVPQGCSGAIYTQTTDCETEVNGIMTYDRRVTKMQLPRFADMNRKVVNSLNGK